MSFIDFARAHGVAIDPSRLYASEKIRRCGTVEKPRSGNGAYYWDGERGWVMDWSGEARVIWYEDPHAKPWTDEEKRAWAAKRASAATEQEKKYERAAFQADVTLRSAKYSEHPYLVIKGFKETRGLVLDDKLLIPMRNVSTNRLQGYQSIRWDMEARKYEKKMLTGMRAKNAVLYLGARDANECWLVEGFATGLSVRHALRSVGIPASVVICFSASNMIQVADQIKGNRFIFADNDESKTGENAAMATGLPWTMADTVGWDANDLHMNDSLFSVVAKIMECRQKAQVYC
ncbi:primase-like protein [Caudoviricetes sp.]|nr:primase-like protein [Caudoviricetes sp.]